MIPYSARFHFRCGRLCLRCGIRLLYVLVVRLFRISAIICRFFFCCYFISRLFCFFYSLCSRLFFFFLFFR